MRKRARASALGAGRSQQDGDLYRVRLGSGVAYFGQVYAQTRGLAYDR
jgi:hypothetical protein